MGDGGLEEISKDFACSGAVDVDAEVVDHDSESLVLVDRACFFGREMACVAVVENESIRAPKLIKRFHGGWIRTWIQVSMSSSPRNVFFAMR